MTSMGGLQEISAQKTLIYPFTLNSILIRPRVYNKGPKRDLVELIGTGFGFGLGLGSLGD